MASRVLMTGNDAIGEGAIRAGCDAYFGYPITPQNELTAYMAKHMPEKGRTFIQAESELAAVSMVFGVAVAGKRGMTSSSSPGISLKQEGISYLAGAELPAVIANIQRGGPGLGNIAPAQGDYFQATKGGGHGDYHQIVLAPDSVQEMHDLTILAFELADRYRTPVMILTDGRLGQMMAITTLSKTGLIASEPIRGVSSIQVHTRLGEPPSHGELFSEHWKGDHPNPIPELIGHYNRGMSIPAIQGWANESGNRVPMYTSGVTEPITTHLEMASMTRRGLTDPLHDAVLIGCKDSELGQKVAGQYGGNWRVQLVTETNSAKLQELAREQGFTRINRITDVSGPDVLPALPLGGQPFSSPWTLPEARSLAKGIERFNDTVGLLYKVADKDMPRGIQLPLEFAGPLIRDIQSGREGRFHPFASHVLEQAGRFGMSEIPGLTKSLTKQGMLPASFKLHPAMAGVPDIVAGAASQIGRRELVPSIGEVTNYLDGVNKAAWATVGGLVSGPEGAAIASTSAGLAADVLREVTQPAFDRGAHTPVRRQMMESWRTHVKAAVAHGAPVQTFSKMFGEDFIRKTGFNQQVVADLDRRARLAEAIRPIGQGSSSGQLRPSDLSFDRAPVIVTPTQDEVWKRTPGFLPPDGFGGAGIPTTDYRLPSNVSLGGKRGGVAMRADVVTDKPADMSGIFGGGTSMRSTNQQSHLICPFLLFCAISSGSETE